MKKQTVYKVKTFQEFKSVLREHEVETNTKYVFIKGTSSFTQENDPLTSLRASAWATSYGKVNYKSVKRLHWDGSTPYFHFGNRIYDCHQGADINLYKKKKYAALKDQEALQNIQVKRYKPHQSKKTGCPARIVITRIVSLPNFKVHQLSVLCKKKMSHLIKMKIYDEEDIGGEELYVFNLPDTDEHKNHSQLHKKPKKEPLDERVYHKVEELAEAGLTRVKDIQNRIANFVMYDLHETDLQSRRYCPTAPVIRSIIQTVQNKSIDLNETSNELECIEIEETHNLLDTGHEIIVDHEIIVEDHDIIMEAPEHSCETEVYETEETSDITSDSVIMSCNETMTLIQAMMQEADLENLFHLNSHLNEALHILNSKGNNNQLSSVKNNDNTVKKTGNTRHNDQVVIVINEPPFGTKHEQMYVIDCDNVCVISHEETVVGAQIT